jgi:hypothetical protein
MTKKKRQHDPNAGFWRREAGLLVILFLFVAFWAAFGLLHTFSPLKARIIGVDPVGYYAWFRSPVFDGDLQFENEYRTLLGSGVAGDTLVDPDGPRTVTGHLPNSFSIGPALLWSPFLGVAHVVARVGGWPADGFSQPYHSAVFFANAFYGLLGALLIYGALRRWFDVRASTLSALGAWAASPMLYYTYGQYAMSHAVSFFCMALFLFLWIWLRERDGYLPWLAIGAALGLASLARWQNVTFALVPTIDLLARDWKHNFPKLAACGAATVVVFFPQMYGWKLVYGSYLTIPQGGGFMDWGHPHLLALLFSRSYGLITWTPLALFGVVGLFLWPRENRLAYVALAAAFVVQLYVQAVAGNVGWSYGMRRMDNCQPLFAVGYALMLSRLTLKPRYATAAVGAFVVWNFLFVLQYAGLLNEFYVMRALNAFAEQHDTTPKVLIRMGQIPGDGPFDLPTFVREHAFPKGGTPTFEQFTYDKLRVVVTIVRRMAGIG